MQQTNHQRSPWRPSSPRLSSPGRLQRTEQRVPSAGLASAPPVATPTIAPATAVSAAKQHVRQRLPLHHRSGPREILRPTGPLRPGLGCRPTGPTRRDRPARCVAVLMQSLNVPRARASGPTPRPSGPPPRSHATRGPDLRAGGAARRRARERARPSSRCVRAPGLLLGVYGTGFFVARGWHGSGRAQGLVRGSAALRYSQAGGRPLPSPVWCRAWPSLRNPPLHRRTP
jgi:hypothetical protein